MDFAQLVAAAAAAMSSPEELVARSARARAAAQGVAPEQILAGWAGVDAGEAAAAPAAAPAAPAATAPAAEAPVAPEPELDVEVSKPAEPPPEAVAPEPEEEPEPEEVPEEVLIGSAGIREMKRRSLPRWLAAAFFVVPVVALFYAATYATGPSCGSGGALAIDPVSGLAENCDGTEYGTSGNPLAVGAALYAVEAAPACSSCHGNDGGGGTGPALAGGSVVATFPSCEDHILWVALGTNGWRAEVGDTYGATNKPVGGGGVMQAYAGGLEPEEIAAVVLFERVTYGNLDPVEATADCFPEEGAEASPN